RPAAQARVEAAVDAMIAPYNLVIRNIARPRLIAAATFCDGYHNRLTPTAFMVDCRPTGLITVPFDGATSGTSADGGAYTVTARYEGTAVYLEFAGEAGVQKVRYAAKGGGLRVSKTLHSDRLDADLSWELVYLRE